MSSSDIAIRVTRLSKCYEIYDTPRDRLKQFVWPRVRQFAGKAPRQYFREFWALRDVSFEVKRGETVGIVGRNGSGKSTLLQMICGTLTPSDGELEVNGRVAALLELGAGFNPEFTGRENVFMNAAILGLSQAETESKLENILDFADIGDFIDQPVKTYSSGMYVRLAFAVIAHVDADILVIDEALSVGDVFFTQKCMRFLRAFRERGTILFVSHDSASVVNLCQRAVWLDKGSVRVVGKANEVTELYLQNLFEPEAMAGSSPAEKGPVEVGQTLEGVSADGQYPEQDKTLVQAGLREFGAKAAVIRAVRLLDQEGSPFVLLLKPQVVELSFDAYCYEALRFPLAGFIIKDRLGQILVAHNTSQLNVEVPEFVEAGSELSVSFCFELPALAPGDYIISVAIGEGTQDEPLIQHWIHDAIAFKSQAHNVHGIFGLPISSACITPKNPSPRGPIGLVSREIK
ncbi:MAG: ABC transporter ATP-binding protein [Sulfurimicrobium sp.]|nr:ABC transporter ATP-binding protein [Sulfurimicrobium sp.]MDZ7657218.1 ABC transporter ATP-binding protein [Sulfurimicrobium sp.]